MKDLTNMLNDHLKPIKALMVYKGKSDDYYIESYDIDENGTAINAHPLSTAESQELADSLSTSKELKKDYLKGKGLLPDSLLYFNSEKDGYMIWTTPALQAHLFFHSELEIPEGLAYVPPMVWKADRRHLSVWAINEKTRPTESTKLCHAPFLNVYESGSVCMGSVRVQIPNDSSVAEFVALWQKYFFNSTFSHTIQNGAWSAKQLTSLWTLQIQSERKFPLRFLKPTKFKLVDLIR